MPDALKSQETLMFKSKLKYILKYQIFTKIFNFQQTYA